MDKFDVKNHWEVPLFGKKKMYFWVHLFIVFFDKSILLNIRLSMY